MIVEIQPMDRRRPAISLRRCERSVVVITPRCQRGNPGSNPGARTIGDQSVVFN